jgi:hypothetical protein
MIAILTADLFSQANTLPLLTIFQLGSEGPSHHLDPSSSRSGGPGFFSNRAVASDAPTFLAGVSGSGP